MKVTDNLENYEVPSRFKLDLEGEERFAEAIAEIIPELEKRVKSKLQTRKYFKQHLRYSSNVIDYLAQPDTPKDRYEFGESYVPYDDEYTWDSNLLQPALLSVLSVERLKYGYIVNLLEEDIYERSTPPKMFPNYVPDKLIKYAQQFDIESIMEEAQAIIDIRKRIEYLQIKKTELQISDILSPDDIEDWGLDYGAKIDALIKLEEKRLDLYSYGQLALGKSTSEQNDSRTAADTFAKACKYDFSMELAYHQLLQLMLRITDDSSTTISPDVFHETFEIIDNEFSKYTESINLYEEDNIESIFICLDHWHDEFKEFADNIYSKCEETLRPISRKKIDIEASEIKKKKAHSLSMFILERSIWNVSGYKADIMYNHRYVQQVYYNINGWSYDDLIETMDQMEDKYGKGKEKAILFNRDANIEAFYEEMVDVVRSAFIEMSHEADTMPDDERLETFKAWVRGSFEHDLPMYIELAKREEDITSSLYHEAEAWIETTIFCITQVFMAAEMRIAQDEELSGLIDYGYFQDTANELLTTLKEEAIANYKSATGDFTIDNKLNDLGEIDADDRELSIPPFDENLLGHDFITEDDLGLRDVEEPQSELNGEVAQDISGNAPLIAIISEKDLPEKKSERESLLSHILLTEKKEDVVTYLKEHLDSKRPTDSVALLVAARELGITDFIPQADAVKLFGNIASRSTFNTYYRGSRDVSQTSKEAYKQALTLQFLSAKSGTE